MGGPFAVNLITIAPNYKTQYEILLSKKVPFVVFAGGIPRKAEIERMKKAGKRTLSFAADESVASQQIRFGIDALILEGSETGGHIGHVSLVILLQQVLFHFNQVPIFVAGGLATGKMIAHLLLMGAASCQLGTRFAMSEECTAHPDFKKVLIKARARQAIATPQYDSKLPVVAEWLYEEPGRNELSVFAKDPVTGIYVRCRFDRLLDRGFSPDLKTTTDASPDGFSKVIDKFGYAFQAAFYMDVWLWVTGEKLDGFGFIAVEKTAPYHVMCFRLGEESIQIGRSQYREALIKYAECLESGIWPGYDGCDQETVIELPYWAFSRFEDELEVSGLEE